MKFIMASVTKFVLLSALLTMFCFGIYDMLKNYESNACEMTYMFEVPEYMVRNDATVVSYRVGTMGAGTASVCTYVCMHVFNLPNADYR